MQIATPIVFTIIAVGILKMLPLAIISSERGKTKETLFIAYIRSKNKIASGIFWGT